MVERCKELIQLRQRDILHPFPHLNQLTSFLETITSVCENCQLLNEFLGSFMQQK